MAVGEELTEKMKARVGTAARPLRRAALGLAVIGYAVFLALNTAPIAGGADSSGYLNSARLLAEGRWTASPRPIGAFAREIAAARYRHSARIQGRPRLPGLAPTCPPGCRFTSQRRGASSAGMRRPWSCSSRRRSPGFLS